MVSEDTTQNEWARHVESLTNPQIRDAAIHALLEGGTAGTTAILAGTQHADWNIRKWCVSMLASMDGDAVHDSIRIALRDPVVEVRRLAISAIGRLSVRSALGSIDAVALLLDCVANDSSVQIKRKAVQMLGTLPPDDRVEGAIPRAVAISRDDKFLRLAKWCLDQHHRRVQTPRTRVRRRTGRRTQ